MTISRGKWPGIGKDPGDMKSVPYTLQGPTIWRRKAGGSYDRKKYEHQNLQSLHLRKQSLVLSVHFQHNVSMQHNYQQCWHTQEIAESWLAVKITLNVSAGVNWRSRPCQFPHVRGEERHKLQLLFNYFLTSPGCFKSPNAKNRDLYFHPRPVRTILLPTLNATAVYLEKTLVLFPHPLCLRASHYYI